jgi:hypothetical protein
MNPRTTTTPPPFPCCPAHREVYLVDRTVACRLLLNLNFKFGPWAQQPPPNLVTCDAHGPGLFKPPPALNYFPYIRVVYWNVVSPSLVLGHVLSPVRSLPRHSLLLIANYTSEPVCQLRLSAIFGKKTIYVAFGSFLSQ